MRNRIYGEKERAYRRRYFLAHKEQVRATHRKLMGYPLPTRPRPDHCECCGLEPEKGHKRQFILGLDHCHVTGVFRGWLCGRCNRAIGSLGDNVAGLMRAVRYLKRATK